MIKNFFISTYILLSLAIIIALSFISFYFYRENRNLNIVSQKESFEKRISDEEIIVEQLTNISPDQKYTAYVTINDLGMRNSKIWIVENSTQKEYLIAENNFYAFVSKPVWNELSSHIAYFQAYPFKIYTVKINGAQRDLVYSQSENPEKNIFNPAIGYLGNSFLEWKDNKIFFEDYSSIPASIKSINLDTKFVTNEKEIDQKIINNNYEYKINVKHFSQRDSANFDKNLGTCTFSIADAGCAVASVAMVLDYFGEDISTQSLNESLTKNDLGYFNGCDIRWSMIPNLFPGIKLKSAQFKTYNLDYLDYELSLGNPVIVGWDKVDFNDFQHWAVVVGKKKFTDPATKKESVKYLVNDPWSEVPVERTLEYFGKRFDHMIVYEKKP